MVMNAVKAYFIRYWKREDMMSSAPLSQHARTTLKMVYLTLFRAMLAAAFGSHLHLIWEERGLIWEAWGMFIVLCFVASLAYLYFTWRVTNRFMLLMAVAFCFGTSIGRYPTISLKLMNKSFLLSSVFSSVFQGLAIVFGCFWFSAWVCRERSQIYIGVLIETWPLMRMWFNDTQWTLKVHVLLALFMVYLMLYSQEILYHAQFGDMDYVNCAFTVFFGLPSIVVHAIRLCLGANRQRINADKLGTIEL